MVALQLIEVKECMQKLLLSDTFDSFSFIDGSITTFATFAFDGYIHKEFYNTDEQDAAGLAQREFATWGELRSYCCQIIQGKNPPLAFKFVLSLSKDYTSQLLLQELPSLSSDSVQGLYLNFQYEKGKLECIVGTSMKTFTMDKSLDHIWDDTAMKYLKQQGVLFEKM